MAEWFKAPVLKTGRGETLSWVRIPPLPPAHHLRTSQPVSQPSKYVGKMGISVFTSCSPSPIKLLNNLVGRLGEGLARTVNKLTPLKVTRLGEPGMYPDGAGLYLQSHSVRGEVLDLPFLIARSSSGDGSWLGGPCRPVRSPYASQ